MPNLLLDIIMAMKDAIARSSLCLSYQPVIRNPWFKRKVICFIMRTIDIKTYENMHQICNNSVSKYEHKSKVFLRRLRVINRK